jgi:hypothetical protein
MVYRKGRRRDTAWTLKAVHILAYFSPWGNPQVQSIFPLLYEFHWSPTENRTRHLLTPSCEKGSSALKEAVPHKSR